MPQEYTQADKIAMLEAFGDQMGFNFSTVVGYNERNISGFTPLQIVTMLIQQGEDDRGPILLQQLLKEGANPALNVPFPASFPEEAKRGISGNAIAFAAVQGVIEACEIMYKHNPDCINAATGDDNIFSAFSIALMQLDNTIPATASEERKLLEERTQVNLKKLIEFFVKAGSYNVDTLMPHGEQPLGFMVLNTKPEATKLLIELGADVNYIRADTGTVFMRAGMQYRAYTRADEGEQAQKALKIAKMIASEEKFDPSIRDAAGRNAINYALEVFNDPELFDLINARDDGTKCGTPNQLGMGHLHIALNKEHSLDTFQKFVSYGKYINTPFNKCEQNVPFITESKLPNTTISLDKTPFIYGCQMVSTIKRASPKHLVKTLDKVKSLIDSPKFDPSYVDGQRCNYIHYAAKNLPAELTHKVCVKAKIAGVDMNLVNIYGLTPLDMALQELSPAVSEDEIRKATDNIVEVYTHGSTTQSGKVRLSEPMNEYFVNALSNAEKIHASLAHNQEVDLLADAIAAAHLDNAA